MFRVFLCLFSVFLCSVLRLAFLVVVFAFLVVSVSAVGWKKRGLLCQERLSCLLSGFCLFI